MKTVWLKNKTDFTKTDNCGNNPIVTLQIFHFTAERETMV